MRCGHGKEALDYASMRMEEAADEIDRLRELTNAGLPEIKLLSEEIDKLLIRNRDLHLKLAVTKIEAADEIERLRADVALWKDRCEAEHQAHMATIKHTETALREIYVYGKAR
jgi:hypothetical protein